jgi:hypothetical protein
MYMAVSFWSVCLFLKHVKKYLFARQQSVYLPYRCIYFQNIETYICIMFELMIYIKKNLVHLGERLLFFLICNSSFYLNYREWLLAKRSLYNRFHRTRLKRQFWLGVKPIPSHVFIICTALLCLHVTF